MKEEAIGMKRKSPKRMLELKPEQSGPTFENSPIGQYEWENLKDE
jgi:hypothetical protein